MSYINLLIVAWRGIEPLNSSVNVSFACALKVTHLKLPVLHGSEGYNCLYLIPTDFVSQLLPQHSLRLNTHIDYVAFWIFTKHHVIALGFLKRGRAGVVRGSTKSLYPQLLYPAVCMLQWIPLERRIIFHGIHYHPHLVYLTSYCQPLLLH